MEEKKTEYRDGDMIYILMKGEHAACLAEDWHEKNYDCDLLLKRSQKNKGKVVVVTKNLMWANRIIRWFPYEKVSYKH